MILEHGAKYGKLLYTGEAISIGDRSTKKILVTCECGKSKNISFRNIVLGLSKSCGQCSSRLIKTGDKFHDLEWTGSDSYVQPESQKKFTFKCKCGNTKDIRAFTVFRGKAKSCGQCNTTELVSGQKIHNFIYIGHNINISYGSTKKLEFKCICGRKTKRRLNSILDNSKCGHCQDISLNVGDKYKNFIFVGSEPVTIGAWSKNKLRFKCRCGNIKDISLYSITSGSTVSCTECYNKTLKWYTVNQDTLKQIQCPVTHENWPNGLNKPIETILNVTKPFSMTCPVCGNIYKPRLNDLKRLKCITCGCTNNTISAPNCQISEFIRSLNFEVVQEFKLCGKIFDIFVPSANLLIELQGIHWHSMDGSLKRDAEKYNVALNSGFKSLWIYEDEWRNKRQTFEDIIANKLNAVKTVTLRPKNCDIKYELNTVVGKLYDRFHYIGNSSSRFSYGVRYNGELIAAMSFRKPSRQSKYCFEMSRMISNPSFRVHGIWSKIMSIFQKDYPGSSVVAYSDNRLFSGSTYSKIGFKFDGDVKPDYYWVRGNNRLHKSALRKPIGCLTTESELRESEGYRKIWDVGKKRWVIDSY